jgi:hypothetical protein
MKVEKARISNINITEKKAEFRLVLDPTSPQHNKFIKQINNFMGMPVDFELTINAKQAQQELNGITGDQMRKLYAIWRDISNATGSEEKDVKTEWKHVLRNSHSLPADYSLADITKDQASDLIETIVLWCIENEIPLSERPADILTDIQKYMLMCLNKKICCVCGRAGEIHHYDAVGMGRDRNKIDDSQCRKMCLCRDHHTEIHTIGGKTFCEKYHLDPVKTEGQ